MKQQRHQVAANIDISDTTETKGMSDELFLDAYEEIVSYILSFATCIIYHSRIKCFLLYSLDLEMNIRKNSRCSPTLQNSTRKKALILGKY